MQINKTRKFVNRHGYILKILDAIAYNANIYLMNESNCINRRPLNLFRHFHYAWMYTVQSVFKLRNY